MLGAVATSATGVKSSSGLYGRLGFRCGAIECVLLAAISSVWPSGAARITSPEPSVPPAPGRLSMTTGWPSAEPRPRAMARASRSVAPPAGNGTTMRIGLLGQAWPAAQGAASARTAATALRRVGFIVDLVFSEGDRASW
jgi:hypothetical protein